MASYFALAPDSSEHLLSLHFCRVFEASNAKTCCVHIERCPKIKRVFWYLYLYIQTWPPLPSSCFSLGDPSVEAISSSDALPTALFKYSASLCEAAPPAGLFLWERELHDATGKNSIPTSASVAAWRGFICDRCSSG